MTNLLNIENYDKLNQEKFQIEQAKRQWKFYKKFGITKGSKQHKKMQHRYQAKKKGISIH